MLGFIHGFVQSFHFSIMHSIQASAVLGCMIAPGIHDYLKSSVSSSVLL